MDIGGDVIALRARKCAAQPAPMGPAPIVVTRVTDLGSGYMGLTPL